MIEQMPHHAPPQPVHPVLPAYELDSVADDKLDALIRTLGLKAHVQNSFDPCCVICRQNLMLTKTTNGGVHRPQQVLRHQYGPAPNVGGPINTIVSSAGSVVGGVGVPGAPMGGNFHPHPANGYYRLQQNR